MIPIKTDVKKVGDVALASAIAQWISVRNIIVTQVKPHLRRKPMNNEVMNHP